jgi:diguanylate cyclase (GGDEF)-like protein/PAS domain S-box-containing protein
MSLPAVRPKILGLINEDASAWWVAFLTLIVGGLLTAMLAFATLELQQRQLRQRFELQARERSSRIEERLADQTQRLDSLRRFMVYAGTESRGHFEGFVRPLLVRAQAYYWLPRIKDGQRETFEAQVRAEGLDGFALRQLGPENELVLASRRAEYYPVLFAQSQGRLPAPLGLDMACEPMRRATLERSARLARITVSSPLELVGMEPQYARGVFMSAPVADAASGELRGFVIAVVSLQQLLAEGLPPANQDNLRMEILDLSSEGNREALFHSADPRPVSLLHFSDTLHLADRTYQLNIRPSDLFMRANQSTVVGVMATLGGLLCLLLSALLFNLVSQRQRAQRRVEQRTWQLRVSEQELRATHNQLRNILDAATQVAIIATDLRGIVTTFNAGAEHMLGYRSTDVIGRLALIDLHLTEELLARAAMISQRQGRDIPLGQAMLADLYEDSERAHEWTLVRRDGSHLTVDMLATTVLDDQSHWVGHLAICIDVTASRRVLEDLAERDRLLEKLSAEVPGGIFQFSRDEHGHSRFTYASQGMLDIYETDLALLEEDASHLTRRIHPDDLIRVGESVRESALQLSPWRAEYRVCLPMRGERWIRGEATPESRASGGTVWHGYLTDITDLKQIEEELRARSVTDVLTGIFNRRYFQQRLSAEMDRSLRDHLQLSLIMLDVDHFKRINDQHGHATGDQALQALCVRIGQRVRRTDVFCRMGGEEFMVLCPNSNGDQAYTLACELWEALRSTPLDGVGQVTASFGVASWRRERAPMPCCSVQTRGSTRPSRLAATGSGRR